MLPIANTDRARSPDSIRSALPDEVLTSHAAAGACAASSRTGPSCAPAANRPQAASAYLRRFYQDATVGAMLGAPDIGGRFFYNDDLTGFNFKPVRMQARRGARRNRAPCARRERRRRSMWAPPPSTPACRAFAPRTISTSASASRSSASGSAIARASPRITTCRTTSPASSRGIAASRCSRPSSSPISTSVRSTSRRPARRSAWSISRGRTSRRFPQFAEALQARAGRRARPGRCDLHSQHVVASHRVARHLQRAGQLLVAPVAGVHGLADERAHARDHDACATCRRSSARPGRTCSGTTCSRRTSAPPRTFRARPAASLGPLDAEAARELRARLLAETESMTGTRAWNRN